MALFEQLSEDVNHLICHFVAALDLDPEQLGKLRRVSKDWKQAVADGVLGSAGVLYKAGLPKFVCRGTCNGGLSSWPALAILNEDGTVLHIHLFKSVVFGMGWTGLGDTHTSQNWIDIPESTVVVGHTLYVLSEPEGSVEKVQKMRLRSFDLKSGNGWRERTALQFSEEDSPFSPTLESITRASSHGPAQTTFKVVASEQFIFVMYFAVSTVEVDGKLFTHIKSAHGRLYDTLTGAWGPFPIPESWSRDYEGFPLFYWHVLPGSFVCSASSGHLYFLSDWHFHVRSLKADEQERPWQRLSFMDENGKPQRFEAFSSTKPTPISGFDELLSLLAYPSERAGASEPRADKVSGSRCGPDLQRFVCIEPSFALTFKPFSMVEDSAALKQPFGIVINDVSSLSRLYHVRGEPLILDEEAGRWQRSRETVLYRDASGEGHSLELCWSALLPLFEEAE